MIKNLIDAIKEVAEHIDGVKFFRYDGRDKQNAQNNNKTIQIWVEDDIYTEYLITRDVVKTTIHIDILDKVYQGDIIEEVHNNTFNIAIVLMKLIEKVYPSQVSLVDYSLMTLSDYTDDELYGCRLTVYLIMPSPIDECNIDDFLNELNKYEEEEDNEIDIKAPKIDISNININPIKIPKNKKKNKC